MLRVTRLAMRTPHRPTFRMASSVTKAGLDKADMLAKMTNLKNARNTYPTDFGIYKAELKHLGDKMDIKFQHLSELLKLIREDVKNSNGDVKLLSTRTDGQFAKTDRWIFAILAFAVGKGGYDEIKDHGGLRGITDTIMGPREAPPPSAPTPPPSPPA
ncbi:hypothetical protein B9Z19DRAFT_1132774 [Tuber borchii]|uniref:Uncharacterized protein n=1 Tax=Tuber borchii TaxID=42251 RepID=A0A2T6ZGT6_TUBBO|nr:hypothetical protein B9Z19DRAFT_1132774 [Tuber borchii]